VVLLLICLGSLPYINNDEPLVMGLAIHMQIRILVYIYLGSFKKKKKIDCTQRLNTYKRYMNMCAW
jgi:hypothetical protein